MNFLFTLAWIFLTSALTAYVARARGRSPFRWFLIGFFFGLLGLLALFLFPKKEEAGVQHTEPPPLAPQQPPALLFWYYLDEKHQQQGPLSSVAFDTVRKEGKLGVNTYVWNTDMDNWKRLDEVFTPET
jgi:hypothetical protein